MPTKRGFLPVPVSVVECDALTPIDKIICGAIAKIQGKKASCRVRYSTIAKTANTSKRQVIRSLQRLIKANAVRLEIAGAQTDIKELSVPEITARNLRAAWAEKRRPTPIKIVG